MGWSYVGHRWSPHLTVEIGILTVFTWATSQAPQSRDHGTWQHPHRQEICEGERTKGKEQEKTNPTCIFYFISQGASFWNKEEELDLKD